MMSEPPCPPTLGLVLAGGLARRMGGGDKALIRIGGATILDRVLACLSSQCAGVAINANGVTITTLLRWIGEIRPTGAEAVDSGGGEAKKP